METRRAIAHFRGRRTGRRRFSFCAYKNAKVKAKLHEIFKGKCAYCEVDYAAGQPGDVEHFRPKGRVSEGKKLIRPGYYWLGAEWSNLLPSCADCNRPRAHVFPGGRRESRGKGDQFPLANPARRARRPGQERYERVLLLDPSRSTPERHLEFTRDRLRLGVVRPALLGNGRESEKGKHSIQVYGLDRVGLVKARRDHALRIRDVVMILCKTCRRLEGCPNSRELQTDLDSHVRSLACNFLAEDKVFLGMVRQLVFPAARVLAGRRRFRKFASRLGPILPPRGWPRV
jgi:uncharacterized protein (TIGR02646 family)